MKLLIGQGRHTRAGEPDAPVRGWAGSGQAFPIFGSTSLREMTARAFSGYNSNQGLVWNHPIPAEERARIRPADRSGYVRAAREAGPGLACCRGVVAPHGGKKTRPIGTLAAIVLG